MTALELDRRQFMQWGVAAGWLASQAWPTWARADIPQGASVSGVDTDPFLQLALMHGFADHAPQAWPLGMRLSVVLDHIDRKALAQKLGPGVQIQTLFQDAANTWATLSLSKEALLRLHEQGLNQCFQAHLWGAPWSHTEQRAMTMQSSLEITHPTSTCEVAGQSVASATRQRVLVIDHGFPLTHLRESGLAYLHHASHAHNRPATLARACSHGAQTLGLLLQTGSASLGQADAPLLLYELPDALMGSMPLGALWPDILDAVHWGVHRVKAGEELIILLSVVSNDGNRHPLSFVTQSAQALQRHAKALGIELKWVMAAGNQHHGQQHLRYRVLPGQSAVWQWELPVHNEQASFLECWHDASVGPSEVLFKAPGGPWQSPGHQVSSASRLDPSGKIQTVFRLPATSCPHAPQDMGQAGVWQVRWQAPGRTTDLDVHLSMMSSNQAGPFRQAKLFDHPDSTATPLPIQSLSGVVPHMPGVWIAQALRRGVSEPLMMQPWPHQLSDYSGRWPSDHDLHGAQCAGALVDPSSLWPGLNVMSLHGHRLHRATGSSMAVPLVAKGLMAGRLG